mmetsp:Transcript_8961/g.21288  ORF Transcript_8961/g.21288 Transcript_8961/m.21288 type:complete len:412 (-) Transcript_8961:649-1884(-)
MPVEVPHRGETKRGFAELAPVKRGRILVAWTADRLYLHALHQTRVDNLGIRAAHQLSADEIVTRRDEIGGRDVLICSIDPLHGLGPLHHVAHVGQGRHSRSQSAEQVGSPSLGVAVLVHLQRLGSVHTHSIGADLHKHRPLFRPSKVLARFRIDGDVEGAPIPLCGQGFGLVLRDEAAWISFQNVQRARGQAATGFARGRQEGFRRGHLIVVNHHPLRIVGPAHPSSEVGVREELDPVRPGLGQAGGRHDVHEVRHVLLGLNPVEGSEDVSGGLRDSEPRICDVVVIRRRDRGRVRGERDLARRDSFQGKIVELVDTQHLFIVLPSGVTHENVITGEPHQRRASANQSLALCRGSAEVFPLDDSVGFRERGAMLPSMHCAFRESLLQLRDLSVDIDDVNVPQLQGLPNLQQ